MGNTCDCQESKAEMLSGTFEQHASLEPEDAITLDPNSRTDPAVHLAMSEHQQKVSTFETPHNQPETEMPSGTFEQHASPEREDAIKLDPNSYTDPAVHPAMSEHQQQVSSFETPYNQPETCFVPAPPDTCFVPAPEYRESVTAEAETKPFEGIWLREQDGQEMCLIFADILVWAAGFAGADNPVTVLSENKIQIDLDGDRQTAVLEADAAGRSFLYWSDGEVWMRGDPALFEERRFAAGRR